METGLGGRSGGRCRLLETVHDESSDGVRLGCEGGTRSGRGSEGGGGEAVEVVLLPGGVDTGWRRQGYSSRMLGGD